jgi:hypothetical protein
MPGPQFSTHTTYDYFGRLADSVVGPGAKLESGYNHEALVVTQGHRRFRNGSWSGGGPFLVRKSTLANTMKVLTFYPAFQWTPAKYQVFQVANALSAGAGTAASLKNPWTTTEKDGLNTLYSSGYAKARPGNPVAGLGQFIIELRDLPQIPFTSLYASQRKVPFAAIPGILLRTLEGFRSLGSEYLNVVFGWKPFVSDLRKTYYLWQAIDKQMAQIVRDNGKGIRRKRTLSDDTVMTETAKTGTCTVYGFPPIQPEWVVTWNCRITTQLKTKVWWAGSFRYYIPDVSSSAWNKRARLALFGALPTPELLWSVLPWSWLIDWFSNVGDVISNISPNAIPNLTTDYAYVMRHTTRTVDNRAHASWPRKPKTVWYDTGWDSGDETWHSVYKFETKERFGGVHPFGVSVGGNVQMTAQRYAILSALGISRAKLTQ